MADSKGSLQPGKFAQLVIFCANTLIGDPMKIKQISVVETIKQGGRICLVA